MNADFIKIIEYASKAPSGHNTQPWKFHIDCESITVMPDWSVALPVVDGSHRELVISLGCAIENLFIAANHLGYAAHITTCRLEGIVVGLTRSDALVEDALFDQIERRQTNRGLYNGDRVTDEQLKELRSVRQGYRVHFHFAEVGTPLANTMVHYIMKGNEIQMNHADFKNELLSWIRFNKGEVERLRNGLSYATFGSPSLPRVLAKPIVRLFLQSHIQNRSDKKKIDRSSHLVVCTTRHDTMEEWVVLGRNLQRFLLKATEMGLACAFLNQPCEVTTLAAALQKALPLHGEYPTLILRIGYAKPLPYSPRKEVGSLLI
ncbi:MAG: Acg family FMN-binding oxidoreductase [Bacteroides sp.]